MTAPSIAPPCLAAPAPSIQVFNDNHKRVHPSQAGYVLQPHQDYWIHVTLQGAAPDQWSIRTGRKPDFIASATVEGEGNPKRVKISTRHRSLGWSSHFLENGADFTLTVQHESADLPNQQVIVPLVPAKPQLGFYLLIVTTFVPILWSAPQFVAAASRVRLPPRRLGAARHARIGMSVGRVACRVSLVSLPAAVEASSSFAKSREGKG